MWRNWKTENFFVTRPLILDVVEFEFASLSDCLPFLSCLCLIYMIELATSLFLLSFVFLST